MAWHAAQLRRVEILHATLIFRSMVTYKLLVTCQSAKRILVTGLLLLHDRGPVLGHSVGSAPTLRTAQLAAPSFSCPEDTSVLHL